MKGGNMGVYKRNENWWIDYYVEGRRQRERIGPSKKLAGTVLKKRMVEIAEGKFLDRMKVPTMSFDEMAGKYLEWSQTEKAERSYRNDVFSLKRFREFFAGKKLGEISSFLIEGYKRARRQEVSPRTVDIDLSCLKHLFRKAVEWGFAVENPAAGVKLFRPQNARLRYLSEAEIAALVKACDDYFRPVVVVAIHTGMRRGEILGLKWRDIDLDNGIIHVEKTKNRMRRDVPMSETVRRLLFDLNARARCEWVFARSDDPGRPLRDCRYPFSRAVKGAGIRDFRFHDMRHTAASHMVMKGVDLRTVQEILGHKSFQMTLRYAHLSPEHGREAVKKMDTLGHYMDTGGVLGKVVDLPKP
jgi:integrase